MSLHALYLAKFFHRPPGDSDRVLLLITGDDSGEHLVMTIALDGIGLDQTRHDCATALDAVLAFRAAAERFRADGYVETEHTKHALRSLPPDPRPQPAWQAALDELMLAHLVKLPELQAMLIDALAATPARDEPFYLWLAASHRFAQAPEDRAAALAQVDLLQ